MKIISLVKIAELVEALIDVTSNSEQADAHLQAALGELKKALSLLVSGE